MSSTGGKGPRVGIVVPTKDPEAMPARRALDAARETTRHLNVAVTPIVSSGPGFKFSRSINAGFDATPDADAWVLLNDDAFMDAGWLDAMLATTAAHPEVGVVGAVLRYPTGGLQHAGGQALIHPLEFLLGATRRAAPFWALRNIARERFRPHPHMMDHYERVRARHRLDFVTGACQLVTRRCYDAIGGYDLAYSFGYEDVDYCFRALEAGFEIALATGATGVHIDGGSGAHGSPAAVDSKRAFLERWPAARILAATRGRHGIHH